MSFINFEVKSESSKQVCHRNFRKLSKLICNTSKRNLQQNYRFFEKAECLSMWRKMTFYIFKNIQYSHHSYVALYSYRGRKADELELRKGYIYTVTEKCQDGWYKGRCITTDRAGVFPGNYVQVAKYDICLLSVLICMNFIVCLISAGNSLSEKVLTYKLFSSKGRLLLQIFLTHQHFLYHRPQTIAAYLAKRNARGSSSHNRNNSTGGGTLGPSNGGSGSSTLPSGVVSYTRPRASPGGGADGRHAEGSRGENTSLLDTPVHSMVPTLSPTHTSPLAGSLSPAAGES